MQAPCCNNSQMARNDPQVNLRMSTELKERLESAAVTNKRSLTAEVVARLHDSFSEGDFGADKNLVALIARLERDLARADLAAETYRYKLGFVSQALFLLTDAMPPKARLPGDPHAMAAGDWRNFSAAMMKQAEGVTKQLTRLVEEVKKLEQRVQADEPTTDEIKALIPSWASFADEKPDTGRPSPSSPSDGPTAETLPTRRTRKSRT